LIVQLAEIAHQKPFNPTIHGYSTTFNMKSSDDLFKLVKSLTKSEKRYFKLSVSKYSSAEESNYLTLFDAIDSQQEYDEEKLKKKFSKGKAAKNFPTEKNHLFKMILKCLRNYSTGQTIGNKLKDLFREAEFLYDKALYDQSAKILSKAKELAIVHGQHFLLLEIYTREAMLLLVTEEEKELQAHLTTGFQTAKDMFRKSENVYEYLVNHLRSFSISKALGDDVRNPAVLSEFAKILDSPLYKDEKNALSFEAKHYFYFMHGVYNRIIENWEKNYEFSKKDLELHESNPEIAHENLHQYVSAISNFSLAQLELDQFENCLVTLEKLKTLPGLSDSLRLKANSIYYPRMIAVHLYSGNFKGIQKHIGEVTEWLEKNKGLFNRSKEINFYWNIAYCNFGMENYKEAIQWLNRILNDTSLESVSPDMNCYARIFNLIIHYELGNHDLVEYLVRSTGRYLNKKSQAFQQEECLMNFMSKIITLTSKKEIDRAFVTLKNDLGKLDKDFRSDYFDFQSWIDSKLTGRPFMDIVQEKVKK